MDTLLDMLAAWPGARWLQGSGTAYLFVNAAHILGIALLVGGIAPLDAALLRHARQGPRSEVLATLQRVLPRVAAWGLALTLVTGVWLFSVRPHDYVANAALPIKLGLLALALANVAWQHRSRGWARLRSGHAPCAAVRLRAALSLLLWVLVLLAGRWIGFL